MEDDLPYFLGFSAFPGIGPVRFRLLYNYFTSAKNAWFASAAELEEVGLGSALCHAFVSFRSTVEPEKYADALHKKHIGVLTITDPRYPRLLKEIPDPPFVLYIRGNKWTKGIDMNRSIAVVGTRKVSRYGSDVTRSIVSDLIAANCLIVSGMAYGVDAIAHETALKEGGATIAVLGCGVDVIAPPSNERLYHAIIESGRGAVISEMPMGLRPNKGLFPARNRIISGLCRGIVVTEGAEDSGALITARYAAEQGREVFAVPGPITNPYSRGPAKLIRQGAILIESAGDILDELQISSVQTDASGKQRQIADTVEERRVLGCLTRGQMHIDAIVNESGLTVSEVAGILTILEMKGLVKDIGEKEYRLIL